MSNFQASFLWSPSASKPQCTNFANHSWQVATRFHNCKALKLSMFACLESQNKDKSFSKKKKLTQVLWSPLKCKFEAVFQSWVLLQQDLYATKRLDLGTFMRIKELINQCREVLCVVLRKRKFFALLFIITKKKKK